MFSCSGATCRKPHHNTECMASWLILGGVIPLAVDVVGWQGAGGPFLTPGHWAYIGVAVMGVATLLVKRAGVPWRFMVALGAVGLLAACASVLPHFTTASPAAMAWPLAVLILVAGQYRCDLKARHRKTGHGVAIVTGASSGIGLATATALQRAGYRVFGTSRKATGETVHGITMVACDVADDASVEKMVREVLAQAGRIDLLVNNAGISLVAAAEDSSIGQAQALFNVNVFGLIRATNAVLPTMRQQGSGRIVHISSILGLLPAPFQSLYASTKHAVEGYCESLDHEVRSFGIRSVLVEPAFTRTSIDQNPMKPDKPLDAYAAMRTNMESLLRHGIGNGDAPEIVAEAVLQAATAPVPALRYAPGKMAKRLRIVRRFLPASVVDKSIRKFNRLPITPSACRY